jgi:hypothetical protein
MTSQKDFDEAAAYANDPATDRNFLAFKFLEAMLSGTHPANYKTYVSDAFVLADEFIARAKELADE